MGQWRQHDIAGKLADVFHPSERSPANSSVLFLHGHGRITLKDNAVYMAHLDRLGLACVCPHGQRSWWGDRLCREFDTRITPVDYLRQSVVPWMAEHVHAVPGAIALLGVSMGGQGALRLAYRHPQQFPIVAALAPTVDFQNWHGRGLALDQMYGSPEEARQDTATLLVNPLNWPRHQLLMCDPSDSEWFEGAQRLASKLYSTGIPFESDFDTTHGGHSWDYFNHVAPRVMQFLTDALEQEQRRLPVAGQTSSPSPSGRGSG
jgi:pimeloyl-ACP methyl ester carboxylesterase